MKHFLLHKRLCHRLFQPCLLLALLLFLLIVSAPAQAARVLIVGDLQYGLVTEIASDIQLTLRSQVKEYATSDVKGRLSTVVDREGAQVVVALGMDALNEALRLPPSVAVVYGLVVVPPRTSRTNITGVYMSPNVSEYVSMVRKYLPGLGKISVVGSQAMMKSLLQSDQSQVASYHVSSSADLVNTVNRLSDTKALLLLPDVNLLTAAVMEKIYLFSFRKNVPLLGISEANVRQGSLFALVFDPLSVSRQIGEKVQSILNGHDAADLQPSPPKRFSLYVNSNTARKMNIDLPDEMLRRAKKVYQ